MDNQTEITDEEIDQLLAEVSGECDDVEGDDFDATEFDDIISSSEGFKSTTVEEPTTKNDNNSADLKLEKEIKDVACTSETAKGKGKITKGQERKNTEEEKKIGSTIFNEKNSAKDSQGGKDAGGEKNKEQEDGNILKQDNKTNTTQEQKSFKQDDGKNTKQDETQEDLSHSKQEDKLKEKKKRGDNAADAERIEKKSLENQGGKDLKNIKKLPEKNSKQDYEKSTQQEDKQSFKQQEKMKSSVGGAKETSNVKVDNQSTGKGAAVKGVKGIQSKTVSSEKHLDGKMVGNEKKIEKRSGKELEPKKKKEMASKENASVDKEDQSKEEARVTVSSSASEGLAKDATSPVVKESKLDGTAKETASAITCASEMLEPPSLTFNNPICKKESKEIKAVAVGESSGKMERKEEITLCLDTTSTAAAAAAAAAAVSASAEDKEEKMGKGHTMTNVNDEKVKEDKLKLKQSKKGWGWSNIGSWGSSVLNQVGGSLYHVLETVESSFVEPGDTIAVSDNELIQKSDVEKLEVIHVQPSIAIAEGSIEVSESDDSLRTPVEIGKIADVGDTKMEEEITAVGVSKVVGKTETDPDGKKESGETKQDRSVEVEDVSQKRKPNISKERKKGSQEHSWFSGWGFSTITGAVQQTGKKVMSTGIDVLENISRKTMSVLGDEPEEGVVPLSSSSTSSLSGSSSHSASPKKKRNPESKNGDDSKSQMLRKCFDDCQGLAHFDALSDLSQVSRDRLAKQLEKFSGDRLVSVNTDLTLIRDASDLGGMDWEMNFGNTNHDFCQLIKDFVSQLSLSVNVQKLFNVQSTATKWLSSCVHDNVKEKKYSTEDIHKMAILMMADFTATGIALFHKIAQLLLVDFSTPMLSYKFRALSLAGLTKVLCTEIWIEARMFSDCLNQPELNETPDVIVSLITNLTLEASNCSTCLQDGYQLLLPIVQLSALKVHPLIMDCSDIANMEVLQLMSGMSQSKVNHLLNALSGDAKLSVQTQLSAIESFFDLSFLGHENVSSEMSDHDFDRLVPESLTQIGVDVNYQKLLRAQQHTRSWLLSWEKEQQSSASAMTSSDLNQIALKSLNDLTICSVELFHLIAQMISMENPKEILTYAHRAAAVRDFVKVLCMEVRALSTKFTNCMLATSKTNSTGLDAEAPPMADSSVAPFVTNIYLEASNSTTYIQDGFQLLLPIMQMALLKAHPACAGLGIL